jgi:hypothetical protein
VILGIIGTVRCELYATVICMCCIRLFGEAGTLPFKTLLSVTVRPVPGSSEDGAHHAVSSVNATGWNKMEHSPTREVIYSETTS